MNIYILQKCLEMVNKEFNRESKPSKIVVAKPSPMRYTEDGKYIIMPDGKLKLSNKWLYEQPMNRKVQ